MTNRTEREKLELAARAGHVKIHGFASDDTLWAVVPSEMEEGREQIVMWSPKHDSHQAAELMIAIKGFGLCGDTVQEWRERVFEAAVYAGSLLE